MRKFYVLLILSLPLLIAARCGGTKIAAGDGRGFLSNVDRHENGAASIWISDDSLVGYCTTDEELTEQALDLLWNHMGEVIYEYRDIKLFSDEEAKLLGTSECGNIGGTESGTEMAVLLKLTPVESRYGLRGR